MIASRMPRWMSEPEVPTTPAVERRLLRERLLSSVASAACSYGWTWRPVEGCHNRPAYWRKVLERCVDSARDAGCAPKRIGAAVAEGAGEYGLRISSLLAALSETGRWPDSVK